MATSLLGPVATCCCFQLKPAQNLPSYVSVLSYKSQSFHSDGLSSHVFSPRRRPTDVRHSVPSDRKQLGKKRKSSCMVVYASLFGVGAPEALVVGVVALLVFGPKGLAEIARNLGKTLRAFQPTIRELQEVSKDFKSTLEREIGMDDVASSSNSVYRSSSIFNENQHTTSDPNGKPTAEDPLAANESPEEQSRVTSEAATSSSPSQDSSTTATSEINAQKSSSENVGEGS